MTPRQREARPGDLWSVTGVTHHTDGGVTLQMTNCNGVTRTENYPAGAHLEVVHCPTCAVRINAGRCPTCGYTPGQENTE